MDDELREQIDEKREWIMYSKCYCEETKENIKNSKHINYERERNIIDTEKRIVIMEKEINELELLQTKQVKKREYEK